MSKPAVEIKGLSKAYMIGHEREAMAGTMTFRDSLVNIARKPYELFTGHQLKKEKFWALKDINLEIEQGDVVGIIGRNGSGKSTLLKVLSRIVEPTKGEVVMRGRVASLLEVGTGFHPELTGRENVYFNGAILGMTRKEIQSKFEEIVAFSEVEKFLDTPVKFYSSGMYVRLAFAVAAHLDPDILIVDEVLAVGDAAFQKKCLGKMKDVAGQGRTVLFVSHSMASVKALCKKAIWINNGKISAQGNIEEVSNAYVESTVADTIDLGKRQRTTSVTGEAKITDISIFNRDKSAPTINSKQRMFICFTVESKEEIKGMALHCGVNVGGQMVLRFMSEHQDRLFDLKKGKNLITCEVNPTNLTGGLYSVDSSILYPGRENMGHIDEVFDAASFVVNEFQVPSGREYLTQKEAAFFADHTWSTVSK